LAIYFKMFDCLTLREEVEDLSLSIPLLVLVLIELAKLLSSLSFVEYDVVVTQVGQDYGILRLLKLLVRYEVEHLAVARVKHWRVE
jgi:hypothetical protein